MNMVLGRSQFDSCQGYFLLLVLLYLRTMRSLVYKLVQVRRRGGK